MNKRMYVLCSRRLAPVYAAVQGSHALAQWVLEHPGEYNEYTTLVYLTCRLDKKLEELREHNYDYSVWKEPDFNMTPTAVAVLGDPDLLFTRLKTLN